MYIPTDLSITGPQLVRLYKGYPIQLKKDALKNTNSRALMHPMMAARLESARRKEKGCRLVMSPEEIIRTGCKGMNGSGMTGTGWFSDAWNWAKQKIPAAFNWVKENVVPVVKEAINSDVYQSKLRPKVEGAILDKLSSLPYADTTKDIAQAGFEFTGIGVKKRPVAKPKPKASMKKQGGSFRVN